MMRLAQAAIFDRAGWPLWLALVAILVLLLLLAAIAVLVSRQVVLPVRSASRIAEKFAEGQLAERMPVRGEDDMARLAVSFNDMAESLSRQITQLEEFGNLQRRFTSDVSHELRTPLTTIRGFAELYRQGAARDVEMLMSRIESESRRMGLLVEDLLLLARLDAQRPLDQHRVDLLTLATDAVHDAQSIAPQRQISMEVFDGPGTPEVIGDEPRLRQVLGNLVANALRLTPEGAPIILQVALEGTYGYVEVRDGGPGLSDSDLGVAFEPAELYSRYRGLRQVGTGVGLALVGRLAERLGGYAEAGHAPEGGAAFRVGFPRADASPGL